MLTQLLIQIGKKKSKNYSLAYFISFQRLTSLQVQSNDIKKVHRCDA